MLGKLYKERNKLSGLELIVSGRIKGAERASTIRLRIGKLNKQDRLSRTEMSQGPMYTKYGTIGVKVIRTTTAKH